MNTEKPYEFEKNELQLFQIKLLLIALVILLIIICFNIYNFLQIQKEYYHSYKDFISTIKRL